MCPVWHVLTICIKSTETVFNLESGAKPRGTRRAGCRHSASAESLLASSCYRSPVTCSAPAGGAGGAGTLKALLPRTSSGGLVTLGDLEIPLWVHEAPPVGPRGQHRGLGDAAPREGEQDLGPTGSRPKGFSSVSWAARQSPSPASLPTAPHPLCTSLSVSGQTSVPAKHCP